MSRQNAPVPYDPQAGLRQDIQAQSEEPDSWAWIARFDGRPAGCVLLYGETNDLAEFRRLWVRPTHRGHGIGRQLTQTVIDQATTEGYETLALSTPEWGEAAQALYESLDFERIPPYPEARLAEKYHDDAIFMQLSLASS